MPRGQWGAYGHAFFFSLANFLIYAERGLAFGCVPLLIQAFNVTQQKAGWASALAIAGFMLGAPSAGPIARRMRHPLLLMGTGNVLMGVGAIWMGANVSWGFGQILASRFFNGVGESFFCTLAPPIIDDVAPAGKKSTFIGVYFTAMPLGMASGIGVTYLFEAWEDARFVFINAGFVWIIFALYFLLWPGSFSRGATVSTGETSESALSVAEPIESQHEGGTVRELHLYSAVVMVLGRGLWWLSTAGYAMQTWFLGGATAWVVQYAGVVFLANAQIVIGMGTIGTALVGSALGGHLVDAFSRRMDRLKACCFLNSIFMAATVPIVLVMPLIDSLILFYVLLFVAQFLCICSLSPVNLALMESVNPDIRSTALGLATFAIHFFGDVPSNIVYGATADAMTKIEGGAAAKTQCTREQIVKIVDGNFVVDKALHEACKVGQKSAFVLLGAGIYLSTVFFVLAWCRARVTSSRPRPRGVSLAEVEGT